MMVCGSVRVVAAVATLQHFTLAGLYPPWQELRQEWEDRWEARRA